MSVERMIWIWFPFYPEQAEWILKLSKYLKGFEM